MSEAVISMTLRKQSPTDVTKSLDGYSFKGIFLSLGLLFRWN